MSHRPPIFARQETLFFAARAMWQTKKWLDAWWEQMGWKILKPQRVVDKLQGLCSKPEKLAEKLVFAGRLRWRHADVKAVSGPEGCSLLAARSTWTLPPETIRKSLPPNCSQLACQTAKTSDELRHLLWKSVKSTLQPQIFQFHLHLPLAMLICLFVACPNEQRRWGYPIGRNSHPLRKWCTSRLGPPSMPWHKSDQRATIDSHREP